jgi:FkbH-like protein
MRVISRTFRTARGLVRRAVEMVRGRPRLMACDVVGRWSRVTSGRPIIRNEGRIEIGSRTRLTCDYGPVELRTAPGALLTIGSRTAINFATVIDASREIRIGDGVSIGPYCIIADSEVGSPPTPAADQTSAVLIDDGAWIASRVTLLPGSHVGAGTVVTAGSVVEGALPAGVVAGGTPARVLRRLDGVEAEDAVPEAESQPGATTATDAKAPTAPVAGGLLISDFTIDPLVRFLADGTPSLSAEVAGFGAVVPTLMAPASERTDFAVVWTRPEEALPSFRRAAAFEPVTDEQLVADAEQFARLVVQGLHGYGCVVVPTWTSPPWQRGRGPTDLRPGGIGWALTVANQALARALAEAPNAYVADAGRWVSLSGASAYGERSWYLGKIPFSDAVFRAAADDIGATVAAARGAARKLVVLDLDNTLWGGVVGDDGWEQLRLGGHDAAGEAFVEFQHALQALRRRGVLLAVVSKNEEATALEAIDRHEAMVLRRDDLVGWRINWSDKAANVAALAGDLNLGLQSVVFIDDNPHERARVREALPEVLVPDWPDDPTGFVRALSELTCFDTLSVTAEDLARTEMYAAEQQRAAMRVEVGSLDDWIRELEIVVTAEPLHRGNLTRATQLLNKTNQMNLRTRRMTETEFLEWADAPGHATWCVSVADRLGEAGLTGLVSVEADGDEAQLVDYVLSCRVMGRRVEDVMVVLAGQMASSLGSSALWAEHLPTAKNQPCRRFFDGSADFRSTADGVYRLDLAGGVGPPDGITIRSPGTVAR